MEHKRKWAAWSLLITGIFVAIFASLYIKSDVEKIAKNEFSYSCNELSSKIIERLHAHAQVLQSGAAFFSVSDTVTREQWKAYIEESNISTNLPGIQGTGFSLNIPGDKLQQHIQKIRNQGFPEYTINPGGKRETYTSIIFLEPLSGRNLRAFGYDMFSEPVRREAMERARDMNVAAISGKVMLVQETDADVQAGNLMYVPVYRKGAKTNTIEQRRNAIIGWVYSPYRMDDLMTSILEGWKLHENKNFYLHIFDGQECTPKSMLFESHAPEEQKASEEIRFSIQIPVDFNGHRWTLVFTQRADNIFIYYISAWTVLFGGILISILLFSVIWSLINTEFRAKQIAEKLTSELIESEKRFQTIFEASPVPLLLTRVSDGIVILANKLLGELFNISITEAIGKKSPDYYVNSDDRNEILKVLTKDGSLYNREIHFKRTDGQLFWSLASFQTITIGNEQLILSGFYDITERKLAEETLHDSREDIYRLLNSMYEGAYGVDINGNCTFVNRAFLQILGYQNDHEVLGKHAHELFHHSHYDGSPYPSSECRMYRTLQTNQPINVSDEVFWRKDGVAIPVEYWSHPIEKDGVVIGSIATFIDITERKQVEDELIKAKEHAEESDRLKTSFLNNISHEIRTPFNGILGFLTILQEDNLTASESAEYINLINKSADRLMNTINDIVEISQIQAGQIKLLISETNIRKLISELYNSNKTDAEIKGLKFYINNDLPNNIECIYSDNVKLNSILTILIGNAIKFTLAGSVELGVRLVDKVDEHAEETHGRASLQRASLQFSVKDTGIGISENKQQAIFEKFMQADGSNTRQFEGSGLGLSIAKAYVEMLNGKIWVESDPEGKSGEKGSVFYFTIPYLIEPDEKIVIKNVIATEGAEDEINPEGSGLKILIAEDDEESAKLLALRVQTLSKEVINVQTGKEAVEACHNNPDIDLVLMDIKMPVMDGYEATRQIRKFNTDVIIIAQTAYALFGDKEKAIEAGCNDYISKPFKRDQLMVLVQKYFQK